MRHHHEVDLDNDDTRGFHDFEEFHAPMDSSELSKKRQIRKKLEDQLEKRRFKASFDELDGEFDWDDFDK